MSTYVTLPTERLTHHIASLKSSVRPRPQWRRLLASVSVGSGQDASAFDLVSSRWSAAGGVGVGVRQLAEVDDACRAAVADEDEEGGGVLRLCERIETEALYERHVER